MIQLFQTAKNLQEFCDSQGWASCLIGGVAVQRWSEVRVTRDVDLSLLTGFGHEDPFLDALVAAFPARIKDAKDFALRNRVLLLATPDGIGIDVSLAALPFEHDVIRRATVFNYGPGLDLRTCSAEDLMVMKLFASRPLDIRDAEGIAIRNREVLDWAYIETQLAPLAEAKDAPEIMTLFDHIRAGKFST
ncbi:MAG: DUF6036 family nucleotidyltransferase [Bryobacteraceae bacterium]